METNQPTTEVKEQTPHDKWPYLPEAVEVERHGVKLPYILTGKQRLGPNDKDAPYFSPDLNALVKEHGEVSVTVEDKELKFHAGLLLYFHHIGEETAIQDWQSKISQRAQLWAKFDEKLPATEKQMFNEDFTEFNEDVLVQRATSFAVRGVTIKELEATIERLQKAFMQSFGLLQKGEASMEDVAKLQKELNEALNARDAKRRAKTEDDETEV